VEAGCWHSDDEIALANQVFSEQVLVIYCAGRSASDIKFIFTEESWMLGCLATYKSGAGFLATDSDSPDDLCDPLWKDFADGDVIGHEEWLCATDNEIIDNHRNEIFTDGVVLTHLAGDLGLGSYSIGRCSK
jgi:hypothetical protein